MIGATCPACGSTDIYRECLPLQIRCNCKSCQNVWLVQRLDKREKPCPSSPS